MHWGECKPEKPGDLWNSYWNVEVLGLTNIFNKYLMSEGETDTENCPNSVEFSLWVTL